MCCECGLLTPLHLPHLHDVLWKLDTTVIKLNVKIVQESDSNPSEPRIQCSINRKKTQTQTVSHIHMKPPHFTSALMDVILKLRSAHINSSVASLLFSSGSGSDTVFSSGPRLGKFSRLMGAWLIKHTSNPVTSTDRPRAILNVALVSPHRLHSSSQLDGC